MNFNKSKVTFQTNQVTKSEWFKRLSLRFTRVSGKSTGKKMNKKFAKKKKNVLLPRRDGRVVYRGGLENR